MKDTAKPAGPVYFAKVSRVVEELTEPFRTICDLSDSEFPVEAEDEHGEFIAEAFEVYRETGLTPREIWAQMNRLLDKMSKWERFANKVANEVGCLPDYCNPDSDNDHILEAIRSAIEASANA